MFSSSAPLELAHLAALHSPSITRAWQSTPHPHTSLVATATADRSVAIWSLRDFRFLSTITGGHKRSVRAVAWKDTGKSAPEGAANSGPIVLATGSFDSNVGIWTKNESVAGGRRLATAGGEDEDDEAFGSDADLDANDADEEEWAFSSLLTGPDSEIKSVAFSPTNPALLATSSRDKSVWVWEDVAGSGGGGAMGGFGGGVEEESEYETIAVLAEHTGDVKCVAWHPEKELLASASYDDTIRLWREVEEEGDWCCVGVLEGHEGTVWNVAWEGSKASAGIEQQSSEDAESWGPRLASCSDDLTVRIWRKAADREKRGEKSGPRLPSIIRPPSSLQTWVQEAELPRMHVRSIYAVAWSGVTGLLASCGGDGGIYVYKEETISHHPEDCPRANGGEARDVVMKGTEEGEEEEKARLARPPGKTAWVVVARVDAAHAEYEVNHVCWARRQDRGRRHEAEEVIISSGDDGVVHVWTLPAALVAAVRSSTPTLGLVTVVYPPDAERTRPILNMK